MDQENYAVLQWFIQKRITSVLGIQGMSKTMDLASGVSPARKASIKTKEQKSLFPGIANLSLNVYEELPGLWPAPDLGKVFRSPMTSAVRTLFMSGTLDLNTPPYQAEEVRWGFPNGQDIIVKNAGHE